MLRSPRSADARALGDGYDDAARRYLGAEHHPEPWACIIADELGTDSRVVGWVDYDYGREWLAPTEANVGFLIFPDHRGHGYANRALDLLVEHLRLTGCTMATMLIEDSNTASLQVASRSTFEEQSPVNGERFFTLFTA